MPTVSVLLSGTALTVLALSVSGCGTVNLFSMSCDPAELDVDPDTQSPISKALRYLELTQLRTDESRPNHRDYAGNWMQCFGFDRAGPFVRDVNPFVPAFVHHALSSIREDTATALGLSEDEVMAAREMRARAVQLFRRFESFTGADTPPAFGFWPEKQSVWLPGDHLLEFLIGSRWGGPVFMGTRSPLNVSFFPPAFEVPADADVTATVYAALLDAAAHDGGEPPAGGIAQLFAAWRDVGLVPQRHRQPWIPTNSGAFLTWLRFDTDQPKLNDVDLEVNANVLYALGRFGALDTPGGMEAINLINSAIETNAHQDPSHSLYYPDNIALHYFVCRAFGEGGIQELQPSVEALAADLVDTVTSADNTCYWDRGDAHINTAFALLALLSSSREAGLVERGVNYLVAEQKSDGSWNAGVFFLARLDDGTQPVWVSEALTTALALEALCRHRLSSYVP